MPVRTLQPCKNLQVVFRYSEGSTEEMLCRMTKCTREPFPFNMPGFQQNLRLSNFCIQGIT